MPRKSATTPTAAAPEHSEQAERALRLSQIASREASVWSTQRVKLQERITAIVGETDQIAADVTAARRQAILGEATDDAIAALESRRRRLDAERLECGQRIAIALEEEAACTQRVNALTALEWQEDRQAEAAELVAATPAADEAVNAAVLALRAALRARLAIAELAGRLMADGTRLEGLGEARSMVDALAQLPAFTDLDDRTGIRLNL